jgi:hypothetical protein
MHYLEAEDAYLRIPDEMKASVCFLCVEKDGKTLYGGTAFFVLLQSLKHPQLSFAYLATAKHCVIKAYQQFGHLKARMNLVHGSGTQMVDLTENAWAFADDPNVDVAVLGINIGYPFEVICLEAEYFATDAKLGEFGVGIGDEISLIGLFTQRSGKKLNIPIMRTGIIAAMPDEPLCDPKTGSEFHAYLIEARSIGGLSGSPVFVHIPAHRARGFNKERPDEGYAVALGLIRGHWEFDISSDAAMDDFLNEGKLNSGIAMVTPIQEVTKIIMENEFFKKTRVQMEQALERGDAFVEDATV